jgi:hypothetical protein
MTVHFCLYFVQDLKAECTHVHTRVRAHVLSRLSAKRDMDTRTNSCHGVEIVLPIRTSRVAQFLLRETKNLPPLFPLLPKSIFSIVEGGYCGCYRRDAIGALVSDDAVLTTAAALLAMG